MKIEGRFWKRFNFVPPILMGVQGYVLVHSLLHCSVHRKISLWREALPGHLHPKLEKSRLTCLGRESNSDLGGEHSSKELFEPRINSYSEHLHISPLTFHTRPILPPLHQLTQTQRLVLIVSGPF